MSATVALVTASEALPLDDDLPPLLSALAAVGVSAEAAVWDDSAVDWARFDLAVVRSTWDYPPRRDEFVSWATRAAEMTLLLNPPGVLRWNTDKRYLTELAAAGLAVVPTTFVPPGSPYASPDYEHVVKPAVSAGSKDTARYSAADADRSAAHVSSLQRHGRTVMVQPYLSEVDRGGERALVFVEGEFSHALTKGPLLQPGAGLVDGLFAPEEITPWDPTPAELGAAHEVMSWLDRRFGRLLYARVDLVADGDGRPAVLEVELAEPSFFHEHAPKSAERFAAAIAARLS